MQKPSRHSEFIPHTNGQTTRYIVDDFTDPWKPSEAVLIQPGFGRHADFWYHWVTALATKFKVIRRDLRGHGFSSVPDTDYDYSVETILNEIVDLLDHLGIQKVHFLGESTGGMLGIAFAAKNPERLHSLTVCSTPTHIPESNKRELAQGFPSWETACREMGSAGFMLGYTKLPGGLAQADPDYSAWWLQQVDLNPPEGLALYARFLDKLDILPFYKHIIDTKLPVLVLSPANSRMTGLADQQRQQELLGGCRRVLIDGYGHEIFIDKAEECQKAFIDFVESLNIHL